MAAGSESSDNGRTSNTFCICVVSGCPGFVLSALKSNIGSDLLNSSKAKQYEFWSFSINLKYSFLAASQLDKLRRFKYSLFSNRVSSGFDLVLVNLCRNYTRISSGK